MSLWWQRPNKEKQKQNNNSNVFTITSLFPIPPPTTIQILLMLMLRTLRPSSSLFVIIGDRAFYLFCKIGKCSVHILYSHHIHIYIESSNQTRPGPKISLTVVFISFYQPHQRIYSHKIKYIIYFLDANLQRIKNKNKKKEIWTSQFLITMIVFVPNVRT